MSPAMMVKTRVLPENNYKAIFFNGKTIRIALDKTRPITELKWPEFYDVKITGKCSGMCPWCYQDSKDTDIHYNINGIDSFFGNMTENQRPFQVALGGGNPNCHPQFVEILDKFYNLGIMPNYTTNGMDITQDIVNATKKYCGGVAISCHNHLLDYWKKATELFLNQGVVLNYHIIIFDVKSVDYFLEIYKQYVDKIDYFVLLPYIAQGRAIPIEIEEGKTYLFNGLKQLGDIEKIAFGANFYRDILKNKWIKASLYEPEGFSKYLDLKDMKLYKSSFNLAEVKIGD